MTQQEQQNNPFSTESFSPQRSPNSVNNPPNDRESEAVYLAELDGEFFTVNYDNDQNPKIIPLRVEEVAQSAKSKSVAKEVPNQDKAQFVASEQADSSSQDKSQEKLLQSKSKFSETKSLVMGIGIGLLIVFVGSKLFSGKPPAPEPVARDVAVEAVPTQKRAVTVATVMAGSLDKNLKVSGTVAAAELIPVTSQTVGLQIAEILVDEGDVVSQGQLLARLNDGTVQAEYAQAQAAVVAAQARLADLQAGSTSEELAQAQQRVKRAKAVLEQAESDLDLTSKRVQRNSNLEAQGAISRDRLDEIVNQERTARATVAQSEASLQEAQQALRQLEIGARPEVLAQAQAELAQARGRLQFATVELNNTQIIAPVSGVVSQRDARVGDVTSRDRNLFAIIENDNLELELQVSETDLNRVRLGQKVTIKDEQGNTFIEQVRKIDPVVNSSSRLATVEVGLPEDANLQPGMFLEAAIATSQVSGVTVPIKALLPQNNDRATIFVLQDGDRVESRVVKMGDIVADNQVEIIEGLQPGEQIIVKGAAYLKDGDYVAVNELEI